MCSLSGWWIGIFGFQFCVLNDVYISGGGGSVADHFITIDFSCFSYLMTALLQASSLPRKPRIEAFWEGLWAWKALVFRLRARGASSVLGQWAPMYICSTSDTLSLLMPTLVRWSPSMVFVLRDGERSSSWTLSWSYCIWLFFYHCAANTFVIFKCPV